MTYTAFADLSKIIASGPLEEVAVEAKSYLTKHTRASVSIFDDATSKQVEIDFRGTKEDMLRRLADTEIAPAARSTGSLSSAHAGPGRPRLGVVAREVTLLPAHWDWLSLQPGGASVTLRKLVDAAKKKNSGRDQIRQIQESAYRFMTVVAGDLPNYEEALRALYARDQVKFKKMMADWPKDVRLHALELAAPAMKKR